MHILADNVEQRLGIISFYIDKIHFNLIVKLLNDRFGIQVRGGCSCAGTYGHYLLHIDQYVSKRITDKIDTGDLSEKPGWIRLSLHPTTSNQELYFILNAIKEIAGNIKKWEKDYAYSHITNEFIHIQYNDEEIKYVEDWFKMPYVS